MSTSHDPAPPNSIPELLQRAQALAGYNLGELAASQQRELPDRLTRAKGLVGQLVERALGANAGNRSAPDFEQLGVELKTLPLGARGRPKESTFVSTIPLTDVHHLEWPQSRVCAKLRRVLWVPIEADPTIPLPQRRIGQPLPWTPSGPQEHALRTDWEELMGLIACGQIERITAHLGQHLQIRPKAAHSQVRRIVQDEHGAPHRTLPLGFYLRPTFTALLLDEFGRNANHNSWLSA